MINTIAGCEEVAIACLWDFDGLAKEYIRSTKAQLYMPVVDGLQKENWLQHPADNELPVFTLLFSSKTFNNAETGKFTTMSH